MLKINNSWYPLIKINDISVLYVVYGKCFKYISKTRKSTNTPSRILLICVAEVTAQNEKNTIIKCIDAVLYTNLKPSFTYKYIFNCIAQILQSVSKYDKLPVKTARLKMRRATV